jgi:hypothetical protein
VLSEQDTRYIESSFRRLDDLCAERGHDVPAVLSQIEAGLLPRPTYVLDDGSAMVPADYFALADGAGGPEGLRDWFLREVGVAGGADADEEWEAYLTGEYGACLRQVSPATIVRKGALMATIEGLIDAPRPDDPRWAAELRASVDELDGLERPFAPFDRVRFGGPVSRDRLITAVRLRFPDVF